MDSWEPPYAAGAALKSKEKNKINKNKITFFVFKQLSPLSVISNSEEDHELALELGQPKLLFGC